MKKKNIFQNQSQEILKLFETARNRSKVMCIPIDYAKKDHVVMFCNGNGKIIRKPFSINNSPEGKDYLIDQVRKSCRHHGINLQHVFYGGEDCGAYADNFITALRLENYLVAGVNALDAKKHREIGRSEWRTFHSLLAIALTRRCCEQRPPAPSQAK